MSVANHKESVVFKDKSYLIDPVYCHIYVSYSFMRDKVSTATDGACRISCRMLAGQQSKEISRSRL